LIKINRLLKFSKGRERQKERKKGASEKREGNRRPKSWVEEMFDFLP